MPADIRTLTSSPDMTCDICDLPSSLWDTGLCSMDREQGMFTGDFTVCPACCPAATVNLANCLRKGIIFVSIDWYWFDSTPVIKETPDHAVHHES